MNQEQIHIEQFKRSLLSTALQQLAENRQRILQDRILYQGPQRSEAVDRIREVVNTQAELAKVQKSLENQKQFISTALQFNKLEGFASELPKDKEKAAKITELSHRLKNINVHLDGVIKARDTLIAVYPASGLLKQNEVKNSITDNQIIDTINRRFNDVLNNINKVENKIKSNEIPLTQLGPLVQQTIAKFDPKGQAAIEKFLQQESRREGWNQFKGALAQVGLGVAAIIFKKPSLAVLGTGVGVADAFGQFKKADDLNSVARSQAAGGHQLVDKEAARFNYVMGWTNLILAGADVGLTVREGAKLLKGARAAERIMNQKGAEVFASMTPEQIKKLAEAEKLRLAGKPQEIAKANAIGKSLEAELGQKDYQKAKYLFEQAVQGNYTPGGVRDVEYLDVDEWVNKKTIHQYQQIAEMTDDVSKIVKNTGIPEKYITAVKQHLFIAEHEVEIIDQATGIVRKERGRFTPFDEVAQLWMGAIDGTLEGKKLADFRRLIAHEYVEQALMKEGIPFRSSNWYKSEESIWGNWGTPEHFGAHDLAPNAESKFPPFAHWETQLKKSSQGLNFKEDLSNLDRVLEEIKKRVLPQLQGMKNAPQQQAQETETIQAQFNELLQEYKLKNPESLNLLVSSKPISLISQTQAEQISKILTGVAMEMGEPDYNGKISITNPKDGYTIEQQGSQIALFKDGKNLFSAYSNVVVSNALNDNHLAYINKLGEQLTKYRQFQEETKQAKANKNQELANLYASAEKIIGRYDVQDPEKRAFGLAAIIYNESGRDLQKTVETMKKYNFYFQICHTAKATEMLEKAIDFVHKQYEQQYAQLPSQEQQQRDLGGWER